MVAKKEPLWSRDFLLIMAANLTVFIGFQILMPIMPLYVESLGVSEGLIGLVTGAFTLTGVITRPYTGRILDNRGRRPIYILGMIICTAAIFSYSLAGTVLLLFLFRLFHGIGWGISSTSTNTIASDFIPKSRLGEGMGYFGLTTVLSMAIAPSIGLFLIHYTSYHNIFILSALITIVATVLALLLHIKPMEKKPENKERAPLLEKKAFQPAVAIFFITLTYGAIVTFLAIYTAQLGISNIGPFFTVYALTLLLARPISGKLSDAKGDVFVIVPGIIALIIAMVLLSFAKTMPLFLMAGFVYGIGFGATNPALQALAVRNVKPDRRGAATGTYINGFDLGIGLGSVLWGLISSVTGFAHMYLLCTIPLVFSLLSFLYFDKKEKAAAARATEN